MRKITKLAVFDFDGTLIDTPLSDTGRLEYEKKTGKPWPHEGWWSKAESLDMTIFDIKPIPSVKEAYHFEKSKDEVLLIMLTGRMINKKIDFTNHVKHILDTHGFEFDEYILNRGGSTDVSKIKSMEKLLEKHTDVVEMELWDDRIEHIPIFEAWGKKQLESGRLSKFKINVVPTGRH